MMSLAYKYRYFIAGVISLLAFSVYAEEISQAEEQKLAGENFYMQRCSDCHGVDGMGRASYPKVHHCFRCGTEKELSAYISARMPPGRRHDCVGECAESVAGYILSTINDQPEPQRIAKKLTVRRLNKRQYNNTVRDLLGSSSKPADEFPNDDFGNGFDRMGDVLSLSPLQFELYVNSAKALTDEVMDKAESSDGHPLLFCDYQADALCLENIIKDFGVKAWRRPLSEKEFKQLLAMYHEFAGLENSNADLALAGAIQAILSSPNFIFQIEQPATSQNQALSQYEVASRLSYFLWDSMPDDELYNLAETKQLHKPEVLTKQVARMLNDEKSSALIEGFFGQWLLFNAMQTHHVDRKKFENFDWRVRRSLMKETELVLKDYIGSDRPFKDVLTNQYTYADATLADFYGFDGEFGKSMEKINLAKYPERFGLLSQGSLLAVTSHPHRTSVVKRGKWVMSNFLCEEPPPPPPGVEGLEQQKIKEDATLRERMQIHSTDPGCKSCHVTMDAIGFAMENYDAVGLFRTEDHGVKIDTKGKFPTGQKFDNSQELSEVIAEDERFDHCVAEKMYIYALSSGVTPNDRLFLSEIVEAWQETNLSLLSLAQTIATSDAFLKHSPQ